MKKITVIVIMIISSAFVSNAQNFEVGVGVGSGGAYLIENADNDVNY